VVQVDPIKTVLNAPETKHSILKYDEPLSNVAFKFNLRRCSVGVKAAAAEARKVSSALRSRRQLAESAAMELKAGA
jgi:hypothetical protein